MLYLKQNTAATVILGPFLDESDLTPETGLTISQADVRLSKNGGSFAQKNDANACTHMENGYYSCQLDATDTNTLGRLVVAVSESGALPVWKEFMVVPANVYDSLVGGSDKLQTDAVEISGSSAAADNVEANIGHLDADVSSRSSHSAADVWSAASRTLSAATNITSDGNPIDQTKIANLDAAVSTRSSHSAADVWSVASRTLTAGTKDSEIDAIKAQTDKLQFNGDNDVKATLDGEKVDLNDDQSSVTVGTVNALGTQAKADVNAQCDQALSDYGAAKPSDVQVTVKTGD